MDERGAGWWAGALDPSRGLGMTRLWVSTVDCPPIPLLRSLDEAQGERNPTLLFPLGLVGPPQNGTYFVRGLSGTAWRKGRGRGCVD